MFSTLSHNRTTNCSVGYQNHYIATFSRAECGANLNVGLNVIVPQGVLQTSSYDQPDGQFITTVTAFSDHYVHNEQHVPHELVCLKEQFSILGNLFAFWVG